MARLAHSLLDDGLIRPEARRVRLALFARAANDNAPPADPALTAWEHESPTSFTPTGKVAQTTDPLGEPTVTTYDAVDRPVFVTDSARRAGPRPPRPRVPSRRPIQRGVKCTVTGIPPNGRGSGWRDKKGNVWVPTGQGGSGHGGPHWDVQKSGGGYENIRPPPSEEDDTPP